VRVVQAGVHLNIISDPVTHMDSDSMFDRQVRVFGAQGQATLRKLKVGIVGLGGTGSIVAQQLAHLGIEQFLLIDPDVVEASNLNRLAGATPTDTGDPKVAVAERTIRSIRPNANVLLVQASVLDATTARLLVDTDFFFCCTDSHGSRAVLNQLAYQYLLPCIDMGVSISSKEATVTHITGRVQMLSPGLACLTCSGLLDADAIRYDLMASYQRQTDPYFIGNGQPEPAVMSLNSTMASLAVTMFLGAAIGIPAEARYQIYNGITGKIRIVTGGIDQTCVVCSKRGALGRGDEWPLPARLI
jgi:molybdopterin/thiamine biosynthesis adenylyltransferase